LCLWGASSYFAKRGRLSDIGQGGGGVEFQLANCKSFHENRRRRREGKGPYIVSKGKEKKRLGKASQERSRYSVRRGGKETSESSSGARTLTNGKKRAFLPLRLKERKRGGESIVNVYPTLCQGGALTTPVRTSFEGRGKGAVGQGSTWPFSATAEKGKKKRLVLYSITGAGDQENIRATVTL